MKITVLDGYTLNPGDLSWAKLKALGDCSIFDYTPPGEVVERAANAEALFTNKTRLPQTVLEQLPALRFIGVLATGYDVVDIAAAQKRGIPVANIPAYGTDSVAQMVFAHLLNLTNQVEMHAAGVSAGRWSNCRDFCYWEAPLTELSGKILGIVGFGRIGRRTAEIARAFGMRIIACESSTSPLPADLPPGIIMTDLDTVLSEADAVTLHCPLTPETRHLIDQAALRRMKRGAFLINTSRGALIDSGALAEALRGRVIAGAGLDVLEEEPPHAGHPLFSVPNCRITPHIAWATREARARLLATAAANLEAFILGKPINIVNQ